MKNNCYGCKDRKVGCHEHCLEYGLYKDKIETENENRQKEKAYKMYLCDTLKRMKGEL